MKRIFILIFVMVLICSAFTGCSGGELTVSGCRVIRDDGKHVTYQTVCDNCGYEYGSPTTITGTVFYSVNCPKCNAIIYVNISR